MSYPSAAFTVDVTQRPVGSFFGGTKGRAHSVACPACGKPALIVGVTKRGSMDCTKYAHFLTLRMGVESKYNAKQEYGALCEWESEPAKKQASR